MKTLLLLAAGLAALTLTGGTPTAEQGPPTPSPAPAARFEVASIKRNTSGNSFISFDVQPDRLSLTNIPVRQLIVRAYQVQPHQIDGGPPWIISDRFDVVAKAETVVPPAQLNVMLQALLAERFKLVFHREERQGDVFRLVKARADGKLGDGIAPAAVDCAAAGRGGPRPGPAAEPAGRIAGPGPGRAAGPAGTGLPPGGCFFMMAPGRMQMAGQPMSAFANTLSQQLGRPVRDETGLSGAYDLTLTFMPDSGGRGMPIGPLPPGVPEPPPIDPNAPALTTAVQEQLGLRLEAGKGPMEMIVIDSIAQPSED
jgi:uncharacterized protein (TIGR03435 family)